MPIKPLRIAMMLDLRWPYRRHVDKFIGAQTYAESQGWTTIIDEFAHETLGSWRHKSPPYDGIIARVNKPLLKQVRRWKIPLVNVWYNSPVRQEVPSVLLNVNAVAQQCAEHLLSRGFVRFVLLIPPKNMVEASVANEFTRIVSAAGATCRTVPVPQDPWRDRTTWQRVVQSIERTLTSCPTPLGIYVCNEETGRVAVQACHRLGLRVPGDVAIVVGESEGPLSERPRPSLTSLDCAHEKIGYEAACLLHRLLAGQPLLNLPLLISPHGLVVRESTDFIAVQDQLVAAALQFIAKHCHRPIGQDDVAQAVHSEVRTLQMRFRKFLGRPIVAEIRRVRIERAKRELTQTEKRLATIALDVGFGDQLRMYKVFWRELGVTPSEYRKQCQSRR